jgi:ABC-type branched-subunit amino acid transport system substrate-binding protein
MSKTNVLDTAAVQRRDLMRGGLGIAGALATGAALSHPALAAEAPLGNYPAGTTGPSVFVGLCTPLTGTYAAAGTDERKGFELAIAHLNSGNELIRKISPLTKTGVLGKKVEFCQSARKRDPLSASKRDPGAEACAGSP